MKNEYELKGDTVEIIIRRKNDVPVKALVDAEDLALVSGHPGTWRLSGKTGAKYVLASTGPRKSVKFTYLHRLIMGVTDMGREIIVDHINHDTLDNRKCNLRVVDKAGNMQNLAGARSDNSLGIRGVVFHKRAQKYMVQVKAFGIKTYGGLFTSKEEAEKTAKFIRKQVQPYSPEATQARLQEGP